MLRQVRYASIALALCVVGSSLLAQQPIHPNTDRGFKPEAAFQMGDIDNINLFNGQLTLTIPIGQSFPMGAGNSYGLTLVYSSRVWDYRSASNCVQKQSDIPEEYAVQAFPAMHSNAGMGWLLSLGRLIDPDMPEYHYYENPEAPEVAEPLSIYEAPDGSRHFFYPTLHQANVPYTADPLKPDPTMGLIESMGYTRDGSYLRKKTYSSGIVDVESPDGLVRRFNPSGELTLIQDPFGNHVNVVMTREDPNDPASPVNQIELKDQHLRTTTIRFRAYGSPYKNYTRIVERVELPAFEGRTASYEFYYSDEEEVLRGFTPSVHACDLSVFVPLLSEILLPASANGSRDSFKFVYNDLAHMADGGDPSSNYQGTLQKMTLPTGGSLTWLYQTYLLPSEVCDSAQWFDQQAGVQQRILTDRDGTQLGIWRYDPQLGSDEHVGSRLCPKSTRQWDPEQIPFDYPKFYHPWVVRSVTVPSPEPGATVAQTGTKTEYYFSTWHDNPEVPSPEGATKSEYGLPFARRSTDSTEAPFISTKIFEGAVAARSSLLAYEIDESDQNSVGDGNRRVQSQRTVFHLDGDKYTSQENSDYDGFGHYRTNVSSGTLRDNDSITRYTAFNENPSGQRSDAEGEFGGVLALEPLDRWITGLFTEQAVDTVVEGASNVNRSLFCFEPATGSLLGSRALKSTVRIGGSVPQSTMDIVKRFDRDPATGNLIEERHFGGDSSPIGLSGCNEPSGTPKYRMLHTYDKGVLATSRYATASFLSTDNTIDGNTGLVWKARDTALVETEFDYDDRGRLTLVTPTGSGRLSYQYNTSGASPTVFVKQLSANGTTTLGEQRYYFDGLGRLASSREQVPTEGYPMGQWIERKTEYNALGSATRVYTPVPEGTTGFVPFSESSNFDGFGRARRLTNPDGSAVTYAFFGQRRVDRFMSVHGTNGLPTTTKTSEYYDNHGRLAQVVEPSGPSGAAVTTEYHYDAGGRLTRVCANKTASECGQVRQFIFDGRGFLAEERHPESGSTWYEEYDARGHASSKRHSSVAERPWWHFVTQSGPSFYDQKYTYDAAERLMLIQARNPYSETSFRPLKSFTWGPANEPGNLTNGKLASATRHNYITFFGDVGVTEYYAYGDPAGRRTERVTIIEKVSAQNVSQFVMQALRQGISYDDQGNAVEETYPTCLELECGTAPGKIAKVNRTFSLGRLSGMRSTSVESKQLSILDSVAYDRTGLPATIKHGNGIDETILFDPSGMARPNKISFSNYAACAAPIILSQPQGGTWPRGTPVTLAVSAESPEGVPLQYTWHKNYVPIAGANGPTYTISSLTEEASYRVNVSTWCGALDSTGAAIGMGGVFSVAASVMMYECSVPPTISTQPVGATIWNGGSVSLSVAATGMGALGYQWYEGAAGVTAVPIGNGSSTLSIASLTATKSYWARVTNDCGWVNSVAVTVTVLDCSSVPAITTQPQSVSTPSQRAVTLTVAASTTGATVYQWFAGGAGVTTSPVGTNSASYTTPVLTASAQYWVRVSNGCGAANSAVATVTVFACSVPPAIGTQPANQTVPAGQTATLSVTASGTGPFSYQWYQGVSGTTTSPVGTNASTYTTAAVIATSQYWVRLTNACGFVSSATATVSATSFATPARRQAWTGVVMSNKYAASEWLTPTQEGSLLLAFVSTATSKTVTPAPGWQLVGWTGYQPKLYVYAIENAASTSGFVKFNLSGYTATTMTLVEYTGISASGSLDKTATAVGTGSTVSSGTAAATSQASELAVTFIGAVNSSFSTPSNGFSEVANSDTGNISVVHDRILTATGPYGHTCLQTGTSTWYGLILTFRAKQLP